MKDIVIKGGRIVRETGVSPGEILISSGKIEKIGSSIRTPSGAIEINAREMYLLPGFIAPDMCPVNGKDKYFTLSSSAAKNGVTTLIGHAEMGVKSKSLKKEIDEAGKDSILDFSFHLYVSDIGHEGVYKKITEAAGKGITSFNVSMPLTEEYDINIYKLLKFARRENILAVFDFDNYKSLKKCSCFLKTEKSENIIRERRKIDFTERQMVLKTCLLADEARSPLYIKNINTGKGVRELRRLRRGGMDVFSDVSFHSLMLLQNKNNEKIHPDRGSFEKKKDVYELWRAVLEETVDIVSPEGSNSEYGFFSKLYNEAVLKREMKMEQVSLLTSTNPARIFGLFPEKGVLREGSDADIAVFDPALSGRLKGALKYTISRGEIIYEKGEIKAERGRARFVQRKPFCAEY